jgi:cell division protein ZapA
MNEVSIEIKLANRNYPLRINETDADAVLRAAALVNVKLNEFEDKYQIRDVQDLFAMTALQLAVQNTGSQESQVHLQDQVAEKISHLNGLLESTLLNA